MVNKEQLKNDIEILKKDVKIVNNMITFVEENIDKITEENKDKFIKKMDELEDQLEIIELF